MAMEYSLLSDKVKAYLQRKLPDNLAILEQMVAINSFTANPAGVNELGYLTAQIFAPLGFEVETVQSVNALYGKHLILTRSGRSIGPRHAPQIGLVSHLDTVFPADEELRNNFHWRIEGDRIYGPGVVDIKGGTIMIYMILSAIQTLAPDIFEAVTWVLFLDATEETGGQDFGRICVQRLGGKVLGCLVFEPGSWSGNKPHLVVARKGMAVYRIEVEGKAAHAGSSHPQGANAVLQMADVITRVCRMTDYDRDLTFNVGTVTGGTVINRVPHFASASVEMRAFQMDIYEDGIANMLALNDLSTVSTANGDFACRVRTKVLHRVLPWPRNNGTDSLFSLWSETAGSLGYQAVPEERAGLSDGNFFWSELPTLDGLGPAGGNAHCSERSPDGSKDQEYVLASTFVPKAHLNTMAILHLIKNHFSPDEEVTDN
jgi:glutamate carboxypeptidase